MISINATTVNDAFHQLLHTFMEKDTKGNYKNTYIVGIDSGSYGKTKEEDGQKRIQADMVAIEIEYPEKRPLAIKFPEGLTLPTPNTEEQIEQYFVDYLAGSELSKDETYTYGSRMNAWPSFKKENYGHESQGAGYQKVRFNQVQWVIDHFKEFPQNNHACIQIAKGDDVLLKHAPCLRSVSFKIVDGKLNIMVHFRSWDLYAGLPTNLGGFQLFNEYVAQEIGVEPGKMFAVSDGLHIYSCYLDMVNIRLGK